MTSRIQPLLSLLPLLSILPAPCLRAQEPPAMFRQGPAHLGVEAGPARLPTRPVWTVRTRGKVRSTPAVAEGIACFGSDDGRFRAVDLKDGRERWGLEVGSEIPCSPAIAQGLVIFQGRDNVLRALDLRSGAPRWTLAQGPDLPGRPEDYLGWDYWVSSPSVQGDTVYVGGGDGKVYAVELASGRVRWSFQTAQRVRTSPAVADGVVYAGSFDGKVYALDAATGKEKWSFDTGNGIQSSPAVSEGTVYVGSRSAAVFALDARTGALKWRTLHPRGSWVLSSPAVAGGKVIVGSSDEQFVHALDARTGKELWKLDTRFRVLGGPMVRGGLVYVGTEGAYTHVLDLETGLALETIGCEGPVNASMTLAGDALMLPSDDNVLHAFATVPLPGDICPDPRRLSGFLGTWQVGRHTRLTLSLRQGRLCAARDEHPGSLALVDAEGRLFIPSLAAKGALSRGKEGEPILVLRYGGKELITRKLP